MPKVNKADIQKEQENYRLFEQEPLTFIRTHNADEILEEFNKSIAVIDNDPNYEGMSSSEAMETRKILIIQVMLQIYGNINFGLQNTVISRTKVPNMTGKLSNSFWINWFINMKPEEIMLGADQESGNTFMYLLSTSVNMQSTAIMYNIVNAEENFLTVYNAYCRNYLDEVCNTGNSSGSEYFKGGILGLSNGITAADLIWNSNLSRAKRIDLLGCINDMVGAGMSDADIYKALYDGNGQPLPFNKIMAKAKSSSGSSSSIARYSNRQAAQTIVANINAATKNQSSQGQALKNAILNLPDNILSQQAKQTLTSSLAQTTNKLRLNED